MNLMKEFRKRKRMKNPYLIFINMKNSSVRVEKTLIGNLFNFYTEHIADFIDIYDNIRLLSLFNDLSEGIFNTFLYDGYEDIFDTMNRLSKYCNVHDNIVKVIKCLKEYIPEFDIMILNVEPEEQYIYEIIQRGLEE